MKNQKVIPNDDLATVNDMQGFDNYSGNSEKKDYNPKKHQNH